MKISKHLKINLRHPGLLLAAALPSMMVVAPTAEAAPARTITGVVMSNPAGNQFVVRNQQGNDIQVSARWGEPASLSDGDRVRAYGTWQGGVLDATNIRVLEQDARQQGVYRYQRTITGVVTNNLEGGDFTMRAPGGFLFRVRPQMGAPADLSVGDRVRAFGNWQGALMRADNIRILRQGVASNASFDYQANRTITGTVDSDLVNNSFALRHSRGYVVQVKALGGEPMNLSPGDQVRVYGKWADNGVLQAANVRVLRESR